MYLFISAAQVKPVPPSPFDVFGQLLFVGLFIYVAIILGIFFLKRGLAWLDDRFFITYSGDVPTYGTLANALMELQSTAQPDKQYVIEMKQNEKQKKEQDDIGGSNDPNARSRAARACDTRKVGPFRECNHTIAAITPSHSGTQSPTTDHQPPSPPLY